jgi:chromosome segregation ATPase
MRNVKVVEDAFEQIKEQTGIDSIDDIVSTFIKAEEQNTSLYNYVNELNSEIDILEEQNKQISKEIQEHEERNKMSEEEKTELIKQKKNDIEVGKFQLEKKEQEIKEKMENLGEIQKHVEQMVSMFTNSDFPIQVAQPMHYDEDT